MNNSAIFPMPGVTIDSLPDVTVDNAPMNGGPGLIPNGTDQALTADATAGGVSFAAFPANTTHVLLTSETAECRYTIDGSAPTTTNGHILASGEERVWHVTMASAAKFIRTGGTSAVISASPLRIVA